MFTLNELNKCTLVEKRTLIETQAELETCPDGFSAQHQYAFKVSKVINRIISEYIDYAVKKDVESAEYSILIDQNFSSAVNKIFDEFKPEALKYISELRPTEDEIKNSRKNLYELAGATELAFANRVSRNVSTRMGSLWEKIAEVSPYAVNPEKEFGITIVGIDLIIKNCESNKIEYAQLKTQRNTLSGSQSGRVDAELSLHDYPIFCACFDTKTSWTFNSQKKITKVCGEEFWRRIHLKYPLIVQQLDNLFNELEDGFIKMLSKGS